MSETSLRQLVFIRADKRCEYCRRHQEDSPLIPLQLDHVLPHKHGGNDSMDNLAMACIDSNLRKGSNLAGIDPDNGAMTPLFNPRMQKWNEHFAWEGLQIMGLTAIGRTTIRVLDMNSNDRIEVRLWATHDPTFSD